MSTPRRFATPQPGSSAPPGDRTATYHTAGVQQLLTTNARDYAVFGVCELVEPESRG